MGVIPGLVDPVYDTMQARVTQQGEISTAAAGALGSGPWHRRLEPCSTMALANPRNGIPTRTTHNTYQAMVETKVHIFVRMRAHKHRHTPIHTCAKSPNPR